MARARYAPLEFIRGKSTNRADDRLALCNCSRPGNFGVFRPASADVHSAFAETTTVTTPQ